MQLFWPHLKQCFKLSRRRLRPRRNLASHAVRILAVAVPVLWLLQHALLGSSGYFALRHKQQQYQQELARVQALETRNRGLNQSVQALRSNPAAIEDIAREQLHLTRPGEVVYTYPAVPAAHGLRSADLH